MQGKALVVNPAVIQPSAPPTIVGRAKKWRSFLGGTCDPTLEKSKKTPVPGRTRDTNGYTGYTGARITQTNLTTIQSSKPNDTPAPGRTTTRRPIQVGCGKRAAGVHGQSVRQVSRYGPTTRVHGVAHLSTAAALPIFHLNAIMLEAWPRADEHGSKVEASNAARRARQPRARRQLRVKSSQFESTFDRLPVIGCPRGCL